MDSLDPTVWLRLLSLLVFCQLTNRRSRVATSRRVELSLLAILCIAAFIGYGRVLRYDPAAGGLEVVQPPLHFHDFYHYYVGTKYFREVGYDGLYEATVIADFEDQPKRFRPARLIRDLETNRIDRTRRNVVQEAPRIKGHFTPSRWEEFKRDIALFRSVSPKHWHLSSVQQDHGYNGTPVVTAVLGLVANQPLIDSETFVRLARWLDLGMLLPLAVVVGWAYGAEIALTFLFFWFVNPLNEYGFVGGSYLRYGYLTTLTLGVAFLHRNRRILSGVCFAASSLLRLFPVFFVAGLFAYHLTSRPRGASLHENRALYVAFGITLAVLIGLTALIRTPEGATSWSGFVDRITTHGASHAPNRIGLKFPFIYSHEHNMKRVTDRRAAGDPVDWVTETTRTFERRKGFYYASVILLLIVGAGYLRGVRKEEQALLLGIFGAFVLLFLAHYYYAVLALIPLIFAGSRRALLSLAGGMIVLTLTDALEGLNEMRDLRHLVFSAEVLLLLVVLMGPAFGRLRPRPRAAG